MEVFVANEQNHSVDETRLSNLARHALTSEEVETGELSILLVSAEHIRNLNKRFAGDNHDTDVLAFPMMEDEEVPDQVLGDVVICPEVAKRHIERAGGSLQSEVETLLVHGTLHLLGYDHQDERDRAEMDDRTRAIIDSFGEPQG